MKIDTFIAVVLDRSGSMSAVRKDTIGGFNTFLADQQKQPGRAVMTLAQFDDHYELVCDGTPLEKVSPLNTETFVPRGSTALHDAIGRTIDAVGAKLSSMPEADRPAQVIVLILTDGAENASREYSGARVAEMIQHQRSHYSWEFVFMGANQDAILAAQQLHIPAGNARQYAATPDGTVGTFVMASAGLRAYRGTGKAVSQNFFSGQEEDKDDDKDDDEAVR